MTRRTLTRKRNVELQKKKIIIMIEYWCNFITCQIESPYTSVYIKNAYFNVDSFHKHLCSYSFTWKQLRLQLILFYISRWPHTSYIKRKQWWRLHKCQLYFCKFNIRFYRWKKPPMLLWEYFFYEYCKYLQWVVRHYFVYGCLYLKQ